MSKKRERVLVFDELYMKGFDELPGLTKKSCNFILFEEIMNDAKFRLREQVEDDPKFKQVIPYTIIMNDANEVLLYQRSKKGNEPRLHNKWSLGIGGHINPGDERDGRENVLKVSAWREVEEEFRFTPKLEAYDKNLIALALLYLDNTPVNKVHFGAVFKYLCNREVIKKSEDIAQCLWISPNKLCEYSLEDWSLEIAKKWG